MRARFLEQNGGATSAQIGIRSFFDLELTANVSSQLDPGGVTPRQRIEFLNGYASGARFATWSRNQGD